MEPARGKSSVVLIGIILFVEDGEKLFWMQGGCRRGDIPASEGLQEINNNNQRSNAYAGNACVVLRGC